jgi:hypothetical protein
MISDVRVGVGVMGFVGEGIEVAISVGGSVVATGETFPHPLNKNNRDEVKEIILFNLEYISYLFSQTPVEITPPNTR